ncbi:MAG: translation initiation factor [Lentisphaeria bacterium]|nr:translation initiation factor [Lentisphaeria bacterium]
MGKKNRAKKDKVAINSSSEIKNNPFSGMNFAEVVVKPEVVEEKPKEEPKDTGPKLSLADQALLAAFGGESLDTGDLDVDALCRRKVFMRIERKHRSGHPVTTIRGLVTDDAEYMMELVGTIKRKLGVGGILRDDVLEFQGNHLDRLPAILLTLGYDGVEG